MADKDASGEARQTPRSKGPVVRTVGEPGDRRFLGACTCGWKTGLLLTAMQANEAVQDHAPCFRPQQKGDNRG